MVRRSIRYRCLYYQRGIDRIYFRTREAAKIKVNAAEVPDIIRQIVQAASAKDAEKIVELITK